MAPLFGKHHDEGGDDTGHLPRPVDMGPQIGEVVQRLAALALDEFAAQVMTQFFKADYEPGGGSIGAGDVADGLMPPHDWPRLGDDVPQEQLVLQDLAAEALQLLEHAYLIRPKFGTSQGVGGFGYVTTRLGRTAIAQNVVQQTLSGKK
jgi:hypothetical protein